MTLPSAVVFVARAGGPANALRARPDESLSNDHCMSVESDCRRSIHAVAEPNGLAHAPAKGGVIAPGEDSIDRQVVGWCIHLGRYQVVG